MSRTCYICGKSPMVGNRVSKTYHHTKRTWKPNIVKVKAIFGNGEVHKINVCTNCLRSDFVDKKVHVPKSNEAVSTTK